MSRLEELERFFVATNQKPTGVHAAISGSFLSAGEVSVVASCTSRLLIFAAVPEDFVPSEAPLGSFAQLQNQPNASMRGRRLNFTRVAPGSPLLVTQPSFPPGGTPSASPPPSNNATFSSVFACIDEIPINGSVLFLKSVPLTGESLAYLEAHPPPGVTSTAVSRGLDSIGDAHGKDLIVLVTTHNQLVVLLLESAGQTDGPKGDDGASAGPVTTRVLFSGELGLPHYEPHYSGLEACATLAHPVRPLVAISLHHRTVLLVDVIASIARGFERRFGRSWAASAAASSTNASATASSQHRDPVQLLDPSDPDSSMGLNAKLSAHVMTVHTVDEPHFLDMALGLPLPSADNAGGDGGAVAGDGFPSAAQFPGAFIPREGRGVASHLAALYLLEVDRRGRKHVVEYAIVHVNAGSAPGGNTNPAAPPAASASGHYETRIAKVGTLQHDVEGESRLLVSMRAGVVVCGVGQATYCAREPGMLGGNPAKDGIATTSPLLRGKTGPKGRSAGPTGRPGAESTASGAPVDSAAAAAEAVANGCSQRNALRPLTVPYPRHLRHDPTAVTVIDATTVTLCFRSGAVALLSLTGTGEVSPPMPPASPALRSRQAGTTPSVVPTTWSVSQLSTANAVSGNNLSLTLRIAQHPPAPGHSSTLASPYCAAYMGDGVCFVGCTGGSSYLLHLATGGNVVALDGTGPIMNLIEVKSTAGADEGAATSGNNAFGAAGNTSVVAAAGTDASGSLLGLKSAVEIDIQAELPELEGMGGIHTAGSALLLSLFDSTKVLAFESGAADGEGEGLAEVDDATALLSDERTIAAASLGEGRLLQLTPTRFSFSEGGTKDPSPSVGNHTTVPGGAVHAAIAADLGLFAVASGSELRVFSLPTAKSASSVRSGAGGCPTLLGVATLPNQISAIQFVPALLSGTQRPVVLAGCWETASLLAVDVRKLSRDGSDAADDAVRTLVSDLPSVPRSVDALSLGVGSWGNASPSRNRGASGSAMIVAGLASGHVIHAQLRVPTSAQDEQPAELTSRIEIVALGTRPVSLFRVPMPFPSADGSIPSVAESPQLQALLCSGDHPVLLFIRRCRVETIGAGIQDLSFYAALQPTSAAATAPIMHVFFSPSQNNSLMIGSFAATQLRRINRRNVGLGASVSAIHYLPAWHCIAVASQSDVSDSIRLFHATSLAPIDGGRALMLLESERVTGIASSVITPTEGEAEQSPRKQQVPESPTGPDTTFPSATAFVPNVESWVHDAPFHAMVVASSFVNRHERGPSESRLSVYVCSRRGTESADVASAQGTHNLVLVAEKDVPGSLLAVCPGPAGRYLLGMNGAVMTYRWDVAEKNFVPESSLTLGALCLSIRPATSAFGGPQMFLCSDLRYSITLVAVNSIDQSIQIVSRDQQRLSVMDAQLVADRVPVDDDSRGHASARRIGVSLEDLKKNASRFAYSDVLIAGEDLSLQLVSQVLELPPQGKDSTPDRGAASGEGNSPDNDGVPTANGQVNVPTMATAPPQMADSLPPTAGAPAPTGRARTVLVKGQHWNYGDRITAISSGSFAPPAFGTALVTDKKLSDDVEQAAAIETASIVKPSRFVFGTSMGALGTVLPLSAQASTLAAYLQDVLASDADAIIPTAPAAWPLRLALPYRRFRANRGPPSSAVDGATEQQKDARLLDGDLFDTFLTMPGAASSENGEAENTPQGIVVHRLNVRLAEHLHVAADCGITTTGEGEADDDNGDAAKKRKRTEGSTAAGGADVGAVFAVEDPAAQASGVFSDHSRRVRERQLEKMAGVAMRADQGDATDVLLVQQWNAEARRSGLPRFPVAVEDIVEFLQHLQRLV